MAAAWLLRAGALWIARDATPLNDEITYAQRANEMLDGKGYLGSYQSWVLHPGTRGMGQLPQYTGAYQSPGYPAFLALVFAASGRSVLAAKIVQTLLGALAVWMVYRLGRGWLGHSTALSGAIVAALHPDLVAFCHYLFTETLFNVLFLGALLPIMRIGRRASGSAASVWSMALAGALLGLGALTRSSSVYLIPVLAAWVFWWGWRRPPHDANVASYARRAAGISEDCVATPVRDRRVGPSVAAVGVLLASTCAVIAPWTIRNYRVHGGLVLIDSSGPYNLWRGNTPEAYARRLQPDADSSASERGASRRGPAADLFYPPPFDDIPVAPVGDRIGSELVEQARRALRTPRPTDVQIMEFATQEALREIRGDPALFARRAVLKLWDMWNPTSFILRHIRLGAYGQVPAGVERVLVWYVAAAHVMLVALALVGAAWRINRCETWLILIIVLYYTAIHTVTFAITRFRVPLLPLLALLAGGGILGVAGWFRRARGERRKSMEPGLEA